MTPGEIEAEISALGALPLHRRVEVYNRLSRALGAIVADVLDAPALAPQLLPAGSVRANDYNPNRVAAPEMELLELSMRADGVTMPAVVVPEGDEWRVVDGFHRRRVITERLGAEYIPCSVIDRPLGDRMASTIRHNRARGKHQVDLMADVVRKLLAEGWEDDKIAEHIGMSPEELLRLRQMTGAAKMLAGSEYSQSWGVVDGCGAEDPAR